LIISEYATVSQVYSAAAESLKRD